LTPLFITFEGTEGSGKSLQARLLVERLANEGVPVVHTREPGGTEIGNQLRGILLTREDVHLTARAELLLYSASRAQLVAEVIHPALERNHVVVCDRYADSTIAYQGGGRGLDLDALRAVISFATAGLVPDMTMLLDLPVEVGLARKRADAADWNRFEAEAIEFHTRVQRTYHSLAAAEPERWHCFDGTQPADQIAQTIWATVQARLGQR
jgi:dTMP kinase